MSLVCDFIGLYYNRRKERKGGEYRRSSVQHFDNELIDRAPQYS